MYFLKGMNINDFSVCMLHCTTHVSPSPKQDILEICKYPPALKINSLRTTKTPLNTMMYKIDHNGN